MAQEVLTGRMRAKLRQAIFAGFSPASLDEVLADNDMLRPHIAIGPDFAARVNSLIDLALQEGWLSNLCGVLAAARVGNQTVSSEILAVQRSLIESSEDERPTDRTLLPEHDSEASISEDSVPSSNNKHLVILVHGINTRAQWFGIVKPALEDAGFVVAPAGYGMYGLIRFLLPFDRFRRHAVERVTTGIRTAVAVHKPGQLSVIAHSFGSFVVARIMASQFDWKWHRVIFCGSVVRDDFPVQHYLNRFSHPIVNEIGTRDCWPAFAEAVTWGFGSVGAHGFQNAAVEERWHTNFRHSDFMTAQFCIKYWVPFLQYGKIERADPPSALPWYVRVLARLPLRWFFVALLVACLSTPLVFDVTQIFSPADPTFTSVEQPVRAIVWTPLPAGTRLENSSAAAVPAFKDADPLSDRLFSVESRQVIPLPGRNEVLESAIVEGVQWYRFRSGSQLAHVRARDVRLISP